VKKLDKKSHFSQETVDSLVELCEVLRGIHNRLLSEGKIKVVKGKTIFLDSIRANQKVINKDGEEITL